MAKIIAAEYVTLDGVMENPAWTAPFFDEEVAQSQHDTLFAVDALLLGRVTYEGFKAAWPSMTDEQGFGDRMNSLPKFVASTTLDTGEWNATMLPGDTATAVRALKEADQDLLIYGSASLVQFLHGLGLIDEYKIMLHPVVLGSGKKLFADDGAQSTLKLVDSKVTKSGVALLTYATT